MSKYSFLFYEIPIKTITLKFCQYIRLDVSLPPYVHTETRYIVSHALVFNHSVAIRFLLRLKVNG